MMYKTILIILMCLTAIPDLNAQKSLSLEECRELALQNSEEIRIARYQIDKALIEQAAVKTSKLPSVAASATGLYLARDIEMELWLPTAVPNPATGELTPNVMVNPVTGQPVIGADGNPLFNMYAWLPLEISLKGAYLAGITIEQPVYTGGRISAGIAMTSIGVEMSKENLAMQQANVIYDTDQSYWLYVSVQEKVKLARAYEQLLGELVVRMEHASETGLTMRNDLLKVMVKHNEAKLQLQKAQSGLELTRMALCRQLGLAFDTPVVTTDSTLNKGWTFPGGTNPGVTGRPEYRLMQQQVEMAAHQLKLAKAAFLPVAGISLGYSYVGGIEFGTVDYDSSNASVMASLKIPLFHWGEGKKKQMSAQHDIEIRKSELKRNVSLMALEIEQARLNLEDARLRAGLVQKNLVQAEENLRVNRDNFEVGMGVLSDLLEAQALWQSARSDLIEAGADLKLKETAYLRATGELK